MKNLYAVQTTLDGSDPERADLLRGAGNFEAVARGVRRLRNNEIPVIVGTVLNSKNAVDVYEIARVVGQLGANGYCVAPLYAAGRGSTASLSAMMPSNDDLATAARGLQRAIAEGLVSPADPAWLDATSANDDNLLDEIWRDQGSLVRRPDTLLRVDPFGKAYTSIKLKPSLKRCCLYWER